MGNRHFSASVTNGSDEVRDETRKMHCEECEKHSSIYRLAYGFCVQCEEYKCSVCLDYHRRHFENHYLQDKASMPKDFCFEKCSAHPRLLIKFYCEQCETFACLECKTQSHQNCNTVRHLPTLAKGTEHSKELEKLGKNLQKVAEDKEKMVTKMKKKCEIADFLEAKSISTITKHTVQLTSIYREQQKEIINKFDKQFEETVARLKNEREQLVKNLAQKKQTFDKRMCDAKQSILKDVKSSNTRLESLKKENTRLAMRLKGLSTDLLYAQLLGQNCKLFIVMKDTENSLLRLRQNMLELENYHLQCYTVELQDQNPTFESLDNATAFFSYNNFSESAMNRAATFYRKIQLKSPCACRSVCLLPGNKLLATDQSSSLIHVVKDIHAYTESYHSIKMGSGPWAITKVEDNKVAVTFPGEGIVRLITFSKSMTVVSTDDIIVGERCCGIAYSNNNLIVSYTKTYQRSIVSNSNNHGKVQVLDMSGI